MLGTITYFNAARKFGFITVAPQGRRVFFHISNFQRGTEPVLQGLVEFEIGPPIAVGKDPHAVNVRYCSTIDLSTMLAGGGQ